MPYTLTWYPRGVEPVTAALRDITPDGLLDAAANCDMPCEWFTDGFLYRLLYAVAYQLLVGADALGFGVQCLAGNIANGDARRRLEVLADCLLQASPPS